MKSFLVFFWECLVSYSNLSYLGNENIPKLCDLVHIWRSFLLTFTLASSEAAEEMLVEAEQGFHPKEKPLKPGLLDNRALPQFIHVDMEKNLQSAHSVHLCLDEL